MILEEDGTTCLSVYCCRHRENVLQSVNISWFIALPLPHQETIIFGSFIFSYDPQLLENPSCFVLSFDSFTMPGLIGDYVGTGCVVWFFLSLDIMLSDRPKLGENWLVFSVFCVFPINKYEPSSSSLPAQDPFMSP